MIQHRSNDDSHEMQHLKDHIEAKTFGRLHDLLIHYGTDGRLQVSAVARSRFVGQLAEWAVLERVAPGDVDLSIRICLTSSQQYEVQE